MLVMAVYPFGDHQLHFNQSLHFGPVFDRPVSMEIAKNDICSLFSNQGSVSSLDHFYGVRSSPQIKAKREKNIVLTAMIS